MCWEIGQFSAFHNHRGQNWLDVRADRRVRVQNFRVDERDAVCGTSTSFLPDTYDMTGAPAYVNPLQPVHQVLNLAEFNQRAVRYPMCTRS